MTLRNRGARRRPHRQDARRAASPGRCRVHRWRWCRTSTPTRPRRSASSSACRTPPTSMRCSRRADVDAVAICSSTDTHVPFMIAAANAGKAIFCEKPISLDLGKVDEALARDRVQRRAVPGRLQPPLRRRPRVGARRGRSTARSATCTSCASPAATRRRRRSRTSRCRAGIFLDMMIHDFDMARFVTGSEVVEVYAQARRARRSGDRRGRRCRHRRRDAAPRERVHHDDRQQPSGRVRLRPASRGVRLRRAWPRRRTRSTHTGMRRSAAGTIGPTDPVLLPRPLHPVSTSRSGSRSSTTSPAAATSPVGGQRRPGPAGDRPRRLEVPPRAPPRPNLRDHLIPLHPSDLSASNEATGNLKQTERLTGRGTSRSSRRR